MSKYTTEVRFICEQYAGLSESEGYSSVASIIEKARAKVFNFSYPIYDEAYRSVLETKILKHFYTREIGFETAALWQLWLDKRMNEIMPYYNQLYKSETLEFNPFYDVDLTTDSKRNINHDEDTTEKGTSNSVRTDNLNSKATGTSKTSDTRETNGENESTRTDDLAHHDETTTETNTLSAYSDTPQGSLDGVKDLNYLTNATQVTGTVNEVNDGSNTGTVKNEGTDKTTEVGSGTSNTESNVANTGTQSVNGDTSASGTRDYTNVDDYLEHVRGKRGGQSYASLLAEYRKSFLNIDMQIIRELDDLFLNLW